MDEGIDITEKSESQKNQRHHKSRRKRKHNQSRPVALSVICLFAFAFYGIISLLFLFGFFFSGWISFIRNKYLPEGAESKQTIVLITAAGFLLHLVSLIGSLNIWYRRRSGYLMLSVSTLMIALFQLFTDRISVFTTAVYIGFIFLFGIFYKRFH
jgi:hypothetical protein